MNNFLRTYLPSSAIAFTVVILFNSIYNLAIWGHRSLDTVFVLILAGLIIFIQLLSVICDHIPFRTKKGYMAVFYSLEYLSIMAAAFLCNGYRLSASNFIYTSSLFVFIAFLIEQYFAALHRRDAEEINRLLRTDEKKEGQTL